MPSTLHIFAGTSNRPLAERICAYLQMPLGRIHIQKFVNDNTFVQIQENVRGGDVYVVQTGSAPVNDGLMELLLIIDALKHASAQRVTAVLPYFPYVRSDKKEQPRISIAARLVADLLQAAGADRVLTMNLHSPQVHGFFRIPVDHLLATPVLCGHFAEWDLRNYVVVSPDMGSAKRVEDYAARLDLPIAVMDKRRRAHDDQSEVVRIVGDITGCNALLIDDEICGGGSMVGAIHTLKAHGALAVRAGVVHAILGGDAPQRLRQSLLDELVVTDTVCLGPEKQIPQLRILSVASMFGEAIKRIHLGESVSALFDDHPQGRTG